MELMLKRHCPYKSTLKTLTLMPDRNFFVEENGEEVLKLK